MISPTILSQISRTEARYLTRSELDQIAEHIKEMAFCREEAALYFWLCGPHEPANGLCLEVNLTSWEAWKVDAACRWIGIPCD